MLSAVVLCGAKASRVQNPEVDRASVWKGKYITNEEDFFGRNVICSAQYKLVQPVGGVCLAM
jgi:hypothetical protein